MATPDLSELKDLIPSRALEILQAHGATLDELATYDQAQLEAIKGIGPKWAADILESLLLLRPPAPVAEVDPLVPIHIVEVDEIEPEETALPDDETALAMALRYLRECGRELDADAVRVMAQSNLPTALTTAIAILEQSTPGTLGHNLAQDVRDRMEAHP
jgi:hypothetical protein